MPADELGLLISLAGYIHRQPPANGNRSEPSGARAIRSLRAPRVAGSARWQHIGGASGGSLPFGAEALRGSEQLGSEYVGR